MNMSTESEVSHELAALKAKLEERHKWEGRFVAFTWLLVAGFGYTNLVAMPKAIKEESRQGAANYFKGDEFNSEFDALKRNAKISSDLVSELRGRLTAKWARFSDAVPYDPSQSYPPALRLVDSDTVELKGAARIRQDGLIGVLPKEFAPSRRVGLLARCGSEPRSCWLNISQDGTVEVHDKSASQDYLFLDGIRYSLGQSGDPT